jgi:hypothetical protein
MLCEGDSESNNNSWKHSQYSAQRFEDALPLSTVGFKNAKKKV